MPLKTKQVGTDETLVTAWGDPTNASQLAGVNSFSDGQNLGSQYGGLVQNVALLQRADGNVDKARSAAGTTGILAVNTEGTKATYSVGVIGFTPAATATDFWTLVGSATKTLRLLRLRVTGIATAAATVELQLIKRTTANTGGTTAQPAIGVHDSNDAAATGVVNTYSVNPTGLGTSGGVIRASKLNLGAAGAAGEVAWDFTTRNSKGLVLRGVAQLAALNWNGAAVPAGTSLCIEVEFTEE